LLHSFFAEKRQLEELIWSVSIDAGVESSATLCAVAEVGKFWVDVPRANDARNPDTVSSDKIPATTTKYCACLLKLVQILGRAESWRMKKTPYHPTQRLSESSRIYSSPSQLSSLSGNPLALDLAIDIAFNLLYLDRIDMRVRHCIPALLLERGQIQRAYDFIKFWLLPSSCVFLEELVQGEYDLTNDSNGFEREIISRPFLHLHNQDMLEDPQIWMDFHSVYTGVGMVFELSYIKIQLSKAYTENSPEYEKLHAQARLLFATVHAMNGHLIPPMAAYVVPASGEKAPPPAAIHELLNHMPPGMDLQYQWGNAGGGSIKEAAGIWQRDMLIWDNDPTVSMKVLCTFAKDLLENRSNIPVVPESDPGRTIALEKAKKLVKELKDKYQDSALSADQIMMHPEMAKLMLEQLHEQKSFAKEK